MATVFVLNGNAFSAASPGPVTQEAATVLEGDGQHVVQLSYGSMGTRASFHRLSHEIRSLGHDQPIGLVGFSAGGAIALRLSEVESLHVVDVLDDYGPPDLRDYLAYHGNDQYANYIRSRVAFSKKALDLFSGPSDSRAFIACAFGKQDSNVTASQSAASAEADFPDAHVYFYPGGHGVDIDSRSGALDDFLAHLPDDTSPRS